jgi:hypothetical protein
VRHSESVPFSGDTNTALHLADAALTALGFRITERTAGSLEAVGPGMNSTRQSALLGASRIRIGSGHGELSIEAELGGVERMSRFVRRFPIGLGLLLAVVFVAAFGFRVPAWIAPLVAVLPWLVIGPWMAQSMRARTCRGLDALLANMVAVGERDR